MPVGFSSDFVWCFTCLVVLEAVVVVHRPEVKDPPGAENVHNEEIELCGRHEIAPAKMRSQR